MSSLERGPRKAGYGRKPREEIRSTSRHPDTRAILSILLWRLKFPDRWPGISSEPSAVDSSLSSLHGVWLSAKTFIRFLFLPYPLHLEPLWQAGPYFA
jgi:hypothetical protein